MNNVLLVIALAVLAAGCPGDDSCGPGDAPGDGLTVTGSGVDLRYHAASASPNNDCPDPTAPAGVVSLTITATQVNGADAFQLCVPRPDLFGGDLPLSPEMATHGSTIEVVDVNAAAAGCTFAQNTTTAPTGTARAEGLCTDAMDPTGFALVITGQVSVDRTCGAQVDTLRLDVAGTISVAAQ